MYITYYIDANNMVLKDGFEGVGAQYQRIIGLLAIAKRHNLKYFHIPIQIGHNYSNDPKKAIQDYVEAAKLAHELGLGINAGHDLSLENLNFFKEHIPYLAEVSIGHALISDALYLGIENTIQRYLYLLEI